MKTILSEEKVMLIDNERDCITVATQFNATEIYSFKYKDNRMEQLLNAMDFIVSLKPYLV